ncbi:MAG: PfkB family carbohydrate kinase [Deinococcales bacterium]
MLNAAPITKLSQERLSSLRYLVLNESEASFLSDLPVSDISSAQIAASTLRKHVPTVIITLGAEGLVYDDHTHGQGFMPAFNVNAIDTTAAGDSFCGALAVKLTEGALLKEALYVASAAGALATTKLGAQTSIPSRKLIEDFLQHGN